MNRYFLRQSVTRKNQIGGSRRRTTTVPGARASPLITCPGPLGGGTVGEDLERPSQSQSWNPGVKPNMRITSMWSSQPGDQSDNNDNIPCQEIRHIYMSLLLLHIILRFLVIRRGDALLYRTVPYRTGTVQPPYCPYCTVRYGIGTVPSCTVRYRTVRYRYRYGGIQY